MSYGEALEQALRALRHRDHSTSEVDRHLTRSGVSEVERHEVLVTLARTGLVDDSRFAELRASALAERGAGDELIRHELERAGIDPEVAAAAIDTLVSQTERAERIVARRGASAKTARYLAGKGFAEDVVRTVVARGSDEAIG